MSSNELQSQTLPGSPPGRSFVLSLFPLVAHFPIIVPLQKSIQLLELPQWMLVGGPFLQLQDAVEKAVITSEMIAAGGDDLDEVRQALMGWDGMMLWVTFPLQMIGQECIQDQNCSFGMYSLKFDFEAVT